MFFWKPKCQFLSYENREQEHREYPTCSNEHIRFQKNTIYTHYLAFKLSWRPEQCSSKIMYNENESSLLKKALWRGNQTFKNIYLLTWERERARTSRGEGEKERILSRFHSQHGVQCRAQSHDPGIMTWAEIMNQRLNQLSHPGAPCFCSSLHPSLVAQCLAHNKHLTIFCWMSKPTTKNKVRDFSFNWIQKTYFINM